MHLDLTWLENHNEVGHALIDKDDIQVYFMSDISGKLTAMLITTWWLQKLGRDCQ